MFKGEQVVVQKMWLPNSCWQLMYEHVSGNLGEEACGFVGGSAQRARVVIRITNQLHSPVAFFMQPQEQIQAMHRLRERHLKMLAIYHSHLHGPPFPSITDIQKFSYPGVLSLIWTPEGNSWQVRAFSMDSDLFSQVELGLAGKK